MRIRFAVLYLSLLGLGAILAHLASEFASMGTDAQAVALSPRHIYLGIGAVVLAVLASKQLRTLWRISSGGRDLKRVLSLGVETLPFKGRGLKFYGLTAIAQFGIGLATEIGEGCPFCGHDVLAGVCGALLTVLALGLCCKFVARRLPRIAAAIACFLEIARGETRLARVAPASVPPVFTSFIVPTRRFCRPPPLLQA